MLQENTADDAEKEIEVSDDLRLIHSRSKILLDKFDAFCRKHNIKYYLTGGTLLGAARHRGFIPWDDDIDLMMFRNEYEKLISELEKDPVDGTFLESRENTQTTPHVHAKFCEKAGDIILTTLPALEVAHSLGIDIFPLDRAPDGAFARFVQKYESLFAIKLLMLLSGGASERFALLKKILRPVMSFFFTMDGAWKIYLRAANCRRDQKTSCCVSLGGRYGYDRETFPMAWFENTVMLPFEGTEYPAPSGYAEYLADHYGACFMRVPEEKYRETQSHYIVRREEHTEYLFTLILCTLGRVAEVERFFESLKSNPASEKTQIIAVDQNKDGRLDAVFAKYSKVFPLTVLHSDVKGLSAARNLALPLAKGKFIAFPDDDCEYLPDTLSSAVRSFDTFRTADAIMGAWAESEDSFKKDIARPVPVNSRTLFRHGESYIQFYRRSAVEKTGMFDCDFGVGEKTLWKSGEDSDYLIRTLGRGAFVMRDKKIRVLHPAQTAANTDAAKVYAYGVGRMRLLAKHKYPPVFRIANVIYPLAMLWDSPRLRFAMFRGRLRGLFMKRQAENAENWK